MAYTQTDLDNVQAAIVALGKGELIVEVSLDGRTTKYAQASLDNLKTIKADIEATLTTITKKRTRLFTTSKGF